METTPDVGDFPDELLENKSDEEEMEVEEKAEPNSKLAGGRVLPDINGIICGELPDAVSDLWGEETDL